MVESTGFESELLFLDFFCNSPIADLPFNQSAILVDAAHDLIRRFPLDIFYDGLGVLENDQLL